MMLLPAILKWLAAYAPLCLLSENLAELSDAKLDDLSDWGDWEFPLLADQSRIRRFRARIFGEASVEVCYIFRDF